MATPPDPDGVGNELASTATVTLRVRETASVHAHLAGRQLPLDTVGEPLVVAEEMCHQPPHDGNSTEADSSDRAAEPEEEMAATADEPGLSVVVEAVASVPFAAPMAARKSRQGASFCPNITTLLVVVQTKWQSQRLICGSSRAIMQSMK